MRITLHLMVLIFLNAFIQPFVCAAEIRVLFGYQNNANYPFEAGDGDTIPAEKPGIAIEMVKAASEKTGINPVFVRLPWKRALMMVASGEIDGLISASYDPERGMKSIYPMEGNIPDRNKRIYTGRYCLYQNKKHPLGWNGDRFTGHVNEIHTILGYSVAKDLREKGIPVEEKPNIRHSFLLLQNLRIDGIADLETSGVSIMKSMGPQLSDVEQASPAFKEKDYYVIFSKKFYNSQKKKADIFWDNMNEIRESQLMENITNKYVTSD